LIFVQISNTLSETQDADVVEYKVQQASGLPLPRWLQQADNGLLLAETPAEGGTIDLKIIAILDDGTTAQKGVTVQLSSGEIQPLKLSDNATGKTFQEQLRAE
ncbi:MAG: hypothetical protein AAFV69_11595, partial [Pseudomonadota bacterium]